MSAMTHGQGLHCKSYCTTTEHPPLLSPLFKKKKKENEAL